MFGNLISGLLGSVIPNLGKGAQAPSPQVAVDASMVPPPAPPPDPVPPAPPPGLADRMRSNGQGFLADLVDDGQKLARQSLMAGPMAKIEGSALKDFNDAAYPGTTPWEQLGGGNNQGGAAYSDLAVKAQELEQRERESQRMASVQLSSARLGAGQRISEVLLSQGGSAALPMALKILRETGGLSPAGEGFDTKGLVKLEADARMGSLDAQTRRSDEMLPYDMTKAISSANLDMAGVQEKRHGMTMREFEFALDEWKAKIGGGYTANELRGIAQMITEAWSSNDPFADGGSLSGQLRKKLLDAGLSEGDYYLLLDALNLE